MKQTGWKITGGLLILSCLLVLSAQAQQAPRSGNQSAQQKIGFINLDSIEEGWIEYQVLKNEMQKLFAIDGNDIREMRNDLVQREAMLKERRSKGLINEHEFENLVARLMVEGQHVAIYARVRAQLVKRKVDIKLDRASKIVEEVIQQYGKEQGFDLILSDERLLGVDKSLDISAQIVQALNSTHYDLISS